MLFIAFVPSSKKTLNVSLALQPNDFVRQSIPFSYIYFEATSRDGNAHSIQVYSDISAGGCFPCVYSCSGSKHCLIHLSRCSFPIVFHYRMELGKSNRSGPVDHDHEQREQRVSFCQPYIANTVRGGIWSGGVGHIVLWHQAGENRQ